MPFYIFIDHFLSWKCLFKSLVYFSDCFSFSYWFIEFFFNKFCEQFLFQLHLLRISSPRNALSFLPLYDQFWWADVPRLCYCSWVHQPSLLWTFFVRVWIVEEIPRQLSVWGSVGNYDLSGVIVLPPSLPRLKTGVSFSSSATCGGFFRAHSLGERKPAGPTLWGDLLSLLTSEGLWRCLCPPCSVRSRKSRPHFAGSIDIFSRIHTH